MKKRHLQVCIGVACAAVIGVGGILTLRKPSPPNWCEYMDGKLPPEAGRCIQYPGFYGLGVYKLSEKTSQINQLKTYWGEPAPNPIQNIFTDEHIIIPDIKYHWEANGRAELSTHFNIFPKTKEELSKVISDYEQESKYDVDIILAEPAVKRLTDVGQVLRKTIENGDRSCEDLVRLRAELCQPDTVISTTVVVAKPIITLTSRSSKKFNTKINVPIGEFDARPSSDSDAKLTMEAKSLYTIAVAWVKGTDALGTFCESRYNNLVCPCPDCGVRVNGVCKAHPACPNDKVLNTKTCECKNGCTMEPDTIPNLIGSAPVRYNGATVSPDTFNSPGVYYSVQTTEKYENKEVPNFGGFEYLVSNANVSKNDDYSVTFSFCAQSIRDNLLELRISNQDGHGEDTKLSTVFKLTPQLQRFTAHVSFNKKRDGGLRSQIYGWLMTPDSDPTVKENWGEPPSWSAGKKFVIGNVTLKVAQSDTSSATP